MGVPGLWDVVHPAGQTRSMPQVATEAFSRNTGGKRGYRIGIDASIWYHHASFSKKGESPELRFLFFRLCKLTRLPFIPLFVFDGRERPKVKRGSRMGKAGSHALTAGFKKLLELFGMEWRMALGEAEAELAWLNRQGVIDAIISDDVDAIVFGAVTTMKNSGLLLSGNKSKPALDKTGKRSAHHVWTYNADDIQRNPNVALSRAGLVLIALLSGGDYSGGVSKIGTTVAHGLARCGFGEDLMRIYEQRGIRDVEPLLSVWRDRANQELQTNASGHLSRRSNTRVPIDFPDFKIMENYVNPVTTERQRRAGGGTIRDSKVMSLPRLAAFCERHFGDWGYEDEIVKRFRTLLWESVLIFLLRHAAIDADERQKRRGVVVTPYEVGTPLSLIRRHLESFETNANDRIAAAFVNQGDQPDPLANEVDEDKNPLRMQIVASRQHVSTDYTLEYRVEFTPAIFVEITRKGCKLKVPTCPNNSTPEVEDEWNVMFDGPKQTKKKDSKTPAPPPDSALRMWVPGVIMKAVHPSLVEAFLAVQAAKKSGTWKGKGRAPTQPMDHLDDDSEEEDDTTHLADAPRSNDGHGGTDFRARIIPPTFTPVVAPDRVVPPHTFVDPRPSQADSNTSALNANVHLGQAALGQSVPARPAIWFPNPDDPDMLVLEDGLDLAPVARPPPRPTASTGPSRERLQSLEGQPRDICDVAYNKTMPIALDSSQPGRAGPPKKTPTRKATSSSQSQRVAQPERRAPEPAPDFAALFADEDPVQSSGRHASDDASNQVFAPRSQRPTAPAPKRNPPPSPPRPQSQRVDPPRHPQRPAEPVPTPEDDDSEGPQDVMDFIFKQACFPRPNKAKRGPAKRPATGSRMTNRYRPAKRPRTQESGPVAGASTPRQPTPPQPVYPAPAAMDDTEVIEIESDDDDTVPKPTQRSSGPPNTQPRHARRFPETGPSFDDDVIDLT